MLDGKVFIYKTLRAIANDAIHGAADITHNEETSLSLNARFTRFTIKSFKGDSSVE